MRLLVSTGISLALRRVTVSPVSAAAATATIHAPKRRSIPPTDQEMDHLWELSKDSSEERKDGKYIERFMKGHVTGENSWLPGHIYSLSNNNDFEKIGELMQAYHKHAWREEKADNVRLNYELIWAAARAKSLGVSIPFIYNTFDVDCIPSEFNWIDWVAKFSGDRVKSEKIPAKKESTIWLLSILRDDLPMLQQLQKESCSKHGRVGPEIEREKTLRYAALTYLQNGKKDKFRSLWSLSGFPLLGEEDQPMQQEAAAWLHHGLLREEYNGECDKDRWSGDEELENQAKYINDEPGNCVIRAFPSNPKRDPAMLRWYAESLASTQRTPIEEETYFNAMMEPEIRSVGGRIEKWSEDDGRKEKLRKWRDDYDDGELDNLQNSLLDYFKHDYVRGKERKRSDDLSRLEKILSRLSVSENKGEGGTVVIDWERMSDSSRRLINEIPLSSHPLVVVGRQRQYSDDRTPLLPKQSKRVNVMEFTAAEVLCSMILAVATRGHLLSNVNVRQGIACFSEYLQDTSKDVSQSILLNNYMNDAILRYPQSQIPNYTIQPVVDHSKAAQWIDKEKKELAFTVAHRPKDDRGRAFMGPYCRFIDYYSLHID